MTPQSSFMIIVPIVADRLATLEILLETMNLSPGQVNPDNSLIPFARFDALHEGRLVIIQANTSSEMKAFGQAPPEWQPSLAIMGEVDGDKDDFLAHLALMASVGLAKILWHCEGFVAHKGTLLAFLQQHDHQSAAGYVNWHGRTVQQVHEELRLQQVLAAQLKKLLQNHNPDDVRQLRQNLLTHVQLEQHEGRLTLTAESPTPWSFRWRNTIDLIALPALLLLFSPVLLLILPVFLVRLRIAETRDPDIDIRPDRAHIRTLSIIEDHDVTNQFNVFGDIKPGLFRRLLLKSIMRIIDYTARHIYRRGFLARVRSIHFARWVFLNNNRSMFFASLYDGSLESYMDDFINKVAFGLNLTFSHGVGYPRTRWMLNGGAELEQPFKNTLRRHQLPSAVWYRAHRGLTAVDMARNARIRIGVDQYPKDDQAIRQWLSEI